MVSHNTKLHVLRKDESEIETMDSGYIIPGDIIFIKDGKKVFFNLRH